MVTLSIGDLKHNPDYAWMYLKGGTVLPGLVGAIYEPVKSEEAVVKECIILTLKGTHEQINLITQRLEDKIGQANQFTKEGIGFPIYLRLKAEETGGYFYSRILEASLVPGKASVDYYASGSLGVELVFTRHNYFDSDEVLLPLSNSTQSRITNGIVLTNCDDASHDNYFEVDTDDLETELPAPLRLEITNLYATGTLKDLIVGSFQWDQMNQNAKVVYEGEDGSAGTDTVNLNASNGYHSALSFSASGWTDLTYWTITAENMGRYQGRVVLPLIRLASTHAYSDLMMKFSLVAGGITLYESGEVRSVNGVGYVKFKPFRIPSGEMNGLTYPYPNQLHLNVYKPGTSVYNLAVDDLLLLPADSLTQHQGIVPLAQGDLLMDDAFEGRNWSYYGGYELNTHIGLNQGHFIKSRNNGRFTVFQIDSSNMSPIARTLAVRAWYRSRKRVI